MKKNNTRAQRLLAAPHIWWSVLFIVAPLAIVVFYAFTDSSFGFSFSNFSKLFNDGTVEVFTLSLAFAFCATCICLVVAYPLAYFISRTSRKTQNTLVMLSMLPISQSVGLKFIEGGMEEAKGVQYGFIVVAVILTVLIQLVR